MNNKEKRDIKIQVRITSGEKALFFRLMEVKKDFNISKLFRDSLYENCKKHGIKTDNSLNM